MNSYMYLIKYICTIILHYEYVYQPFWIYCLWLTKSPPSDVMYQASLIPPPLPPTKRPTKSFILVIAQPKYTKVTK